MSGKKHDRDGMLGRRYLARQMATLLKFASETNNPRLAATLVERAADLKDQLEDTPSAQTDKSLTPPDVES
jgi:hypothetical protein